MADEAVKDGKALMEEIKQEPTLDELLRRDPRSLSDADIMQIIAIERRNRALFIAKDEEKKGGAVTPSLQRRQEIVDAEEQHADH